MITLVTPTGDRPEAFSLCEYWMSRQTVQDNIQWIVVDDGQSPICTTMGQEYIRRTPGPSDPSHTLSLNLIHAIPRIKHDKVLIIEDDDYYSPEYIETMSSWLDRAELVGEKGARYYYMQDRSYYFWPDHKHASLCRTGFRRELSSTLKKVITSMKPRDWRVDLNLWNAFKGKKHLPAADPKGKALCVGLKQLPGRVGVTHREHPRAISDSRLSKFKEWLGRDSFAYNRVLNQSACEIPIYTCLFGGYDTLPSAPCSNYFVVTDQPDSVPNGYSVIEKPLNGMTPKMASRYWKMHPHELFPRKTSLYIDANVTFKQRPSKLVSHLWSVAGNVDLVSFRHNKSATIKDEIKEVLRLRFGKKESIETQLTRRFSGLPVAWCGLILRKDTPAVRELNENWWNIFSDGKYGRDQIIFPIALHNSGVVHRMVDEPTPFYGESSPWIDVRRHNKSRSHE